MSLKITFIGAGSVVFSKRLATDLLQFKDLPQITLCLMDIDASRLKVAETMLRRIVAQLGLRTQIQATTNQREAVRNARYVVTMIQVGGYKPGTWLDFEIPKKYGLRQTIADTLGIGGIFRALRTIPALVSIAEDIADVADPECLFINYSNPMAMNCWAVTEATGVPIVGLCHSVFGTARRLANHMGIPYQEVDYLVAGINHMAFFLKIQHRGQDLYPLLFKVLEDPKRNFEKVRYEMMRRTGYFVTESSEHQSEYVPYFIHHGKEMVERFDIPLDEYMRRCEVILATWQESERKLLGTSSHIEIGPQSYEYGTYIIHSRETGQPRTVYGNVPNHGLISNLPMDCNVEVPCLVDGNGLQPVQIGELPSQLAALCQTNINVQRLTVDAALTGKREHIYHAAMLDPHTAATLTLDQIWAMCDELIEAHQKEGYMPAFDPVVRNTGRSAAGIDDVLIARLTPAEALHAEKGATTSLSLSVENPLDEAVEVSLCIQPRGQEVSVEGSAVRTIRIPAGQTVHEPVVVKSEHSISSSVHVDIEATNLPRQRILCVGTVLELRNTVDISTPHHFDLELDGFEAGTGSLQRIDDKLLLELTVHDSSITPAPKQNPSLGSSVLLSFADLIPQSTVLRLTIVPATSDQHSPQLWFTAGDQITQGTLTQQTTEAGYTVRAEIPDSITGLQAGATSCLFDAMVTISALGDAHSGGHTSLSGAHFTGFDNTANMLHLKW